MALFSSLLTRNPLQQLFVIIEEKALEVGPLFVKWTPPSPPHGMIIQYDICYQPVDESQNETILEWNISQGLTEELTYLITNLAPNSNYSVKVRAYTSVGSGVWSLPLHRITAERDIQTVPMPTSGTSFWIITVAVVAILLLVLGSVGLLWYRSGRQKGGVARPDKPENNGTDVRGNQLVNHHGDVNNEMVFGDPIYYSVEDGEVKIPTYALPDQEMFNNRDSYEPEASMRDEHEYSKTIFTEKKEAVVFCDRGPQYINYKITGHTAIKKA
ncbi:putative insulin-like growth factor 1 receptor [Apostichopus japonicus]|uniref:Putative insulin-like growth factor 1 receptor n=1 Tax=Stichopus japonicus TaxID=307972 RepID=A0A2G8JNQ0_STIJA|nr:putative insulin-like growth factor 1 receptor [Apostichopus japonicus]